MLKSGQSLSAGCLFPTGSWNHIHFGWTTALETDRSRSLPGKTGKVFCCVRSTPTSVKRWPVYAMAGESAWTQWRIHQPFTKVLLVLTSTSTSMDFPSNNFCAYQFATPLFPSYTSFPNCCESSWDKKAFRHSQPLGCCAHWIPAKGAGVNILRTTELHQRRPHCLQ